MRAMIQSDFITMKNSLLQLLGICVIVAIFIWIGTGTLIAGVAAVCAMVPFMYIFSIAAYDEMNGWERFRLTLPISRKQVVLGRYTSILIIVLASDIFMTILAFLAYLLLTNVPSLPVDQSLVEGYNPIREAGHVLMISAAMLFAAACTMPLFMRFGMTKGTRLAPVILVLIMMCGLFLVGNFEDTIIQVIPSLEIIFGIDPEGALLAFRSGAVVFLIALALYIFSAMIAVKLYENRQF